MIHVGSKWRLVDHHLKCPQRQPKLCFLASSLLSFVCSVSNLFLFLFVFVLSLRVYFVSLHVIAASALAENPVFYDTPNGF